MLRTTIVGGVLFLIPFAFLLLVLEKVWRLAHGVVEPARAILPPDHVGGPILVSVAAVLLILAVCFLAGLLARLGPVRARVNAVESLFMDALPGYAVAKATLSGVFEAQRSHDVLLPVLVQFDDHQMVAFEVERAAGSVTVFLPGAPTAWNGSVAMVPADRVTPLAAPVHGVTKSMRVLGRGLLEVAAADGR